jgi:tRNA threonylcarbamoyladenosine biosynthesis protein TsaE
MQTLAAEVARNLTSGDILLLYGELGSGKTTFVQGLARALGITGPVTSPTFTIVGEYAVPPAFAKASAGRPDKGIFTFVHVDLYRLDEKNAASDPAVRDVLERVQDPGRLTVIEWADRLGEQAPKKPQRIGFQHGKTPEERILTFF